jgi:hypothetical protein
LVPFTSWAGEGSVALASDASTWITLVVLLTTFQVLSQAFTVTVNGTPSVCASGVPVFPDEVPGAGLSPGSRICNRE